MSEKTANNEEINKTNQSDVDKKMADALAGVAEHEPLTATFDDVADDGLDVVTLQKTLTAAEEKANDNWDKFLAAKAEADNIRKRAERDVANAHKYALEKFIPELLTVKDSLELGTKAAKDNVAETPNEQMSNFIEGSEMAITMFADTLKKVGVEMIDPQGEAFNPEFHQAMTMVPNPDVAPNTVMEVIQKGYTLNERLVRPAMVIVSKAD